jgi:hypothetical protein
MSTTWDDASKCPSGDGYAGVIESRKSFEGGQIVSLQCPATRCEFNVAGWIVQIRPDNTIPDRVTANERRASNGPRAKINQAAAQRARDMLAQQVLEEQKPGKEVR